MMYGALDLGCCGCFDCFMVCRVQASSSAWVHSGHCEPAGALFSACSGLGLQRSLGGSLSWLPCCAPAGDVSKSPAASESAAHHAMRLTNAHAPSPP
jgi:hypothetical protein